MFRIHFEDDYGQGSFDVETRKEALEAKENLINSPDSFNIWVENLNDPEE